MNNVSRVFSFMLSKIRIKCEIIGIWKHQNFQGQK